MLRRSWKCCVSNMSRIWGFPKNLHAPYAKERTCLCNQQLPYDIIWLTAGYSCQTCADQLCKQLALYPHERRWAFQPNNSIHNAFRFVCTDKEQQRQNTAEEEFRKRERDASVFPNQWCNNRHLLVKTRTVTFQTPRPLLGPRMICDQFYSGRHTGNIAAPYLWAETPGGRCRPACSGECGRNCLWRADRRPSSSGRTPPPPVCGPCPPGVHKWYVVNTCITDTWCHWRASLQLEKQAAFLRSCDYLQYTDKGHTGLCFYNMQ